MPEANTGVMDLWATLLTVKVPTKKNQFTILAVCTHKAIYGSRVLYPMKWLRSISLTGILDNATSPPVVMAPHWVWHRHIFWLHTKKHTHSQDDAFKKPKTHPLFRLFSACCHS